MEKTGSIAQATTKSRKTTMSITQTQRRSAEKIAEAGLIEGLTRQNLRSIAHALGAQDADIVLSHANPRALTSRCAAIIVESIAEGMEEAGFTS